MRAMRAEGFSGYRDLKLAEIPKPQVSERPRTGKDRHRRRDATRTHHSVGRVSTRESAFGPWVRRGGRG
jgi:hypothetical protein